MHDLQKQQHLSYIAHKGLSGLTLQHWKLNTIYSFSLDLVYDFCLQIF